LFAVGNILISDDLVDAPFACNLGACAGACCVHGDSGAPLEEEERAEVEAALEVVRSRLRPEAREVIRRRGPWEESSPGYYATTCVGDAECVFVVYDGPVAKCALQKAHDEGKVDFPKPISCHLYPIRIGQLGEYETLNYEKIEICSPAVAHGNRSRMKLPNFLRHPLVRKYGESWYQDFIDACSARREVLSGPNAVLK
jgi:uncharacterized protein DUF3109